MGSLLKGIDVVNSMKEKMIRETEELKAKGVNPCLAIVRVGERPDDISYERGAIKRCEGVGITCKVNQLSETISQQELTEAILKLNNDSSVHGILLFRPLPKHLDENSIVNMVNPQKDVDCLNPVNLARVFAGDPEGFAPCTPEAVIEVLDYYNIPIEGSRIAVIGRSLVVGKPLSMLLLKRNATVTICHTRTKELEATCRNAEIVIAAAGKAKMVNSSFVSENAVVIDVGINIDEAGNLCGDVSFQEVSEKAGSITPVPGGVGTVTTSVLANHVIRAARKISLG